MIDQLYTITKLDESQVNVMQKILQNVHDNALGIAYGTTTAVTLAMVPVGKILMVDDGTTRQVYMRSGENVLTMISGTVAGYTPTLPLSAIYMALDGSNATTDLNIGANGFTTTGAVTGAAFYFGSVTEGSWRLTNVGTDLMAQCYQGGNWIDKGGFTP